MLVVVVVETNVLLSRGWRGNTCYNVTLRRRIFAKRLSGLIHWYWEDGTPSDIPRVIIKSLLVHFPSLLLRADLPIEGHPILSESTSLGNWWRPRAGRV